MTRERKEEEKKKKSVGTIIPDGIYGKHRVLTKAYSSLENGYF